MNEPEEYIAFFDDRSEGLENQEHSVMARSAEEALGKVQAEYPFAVITEIVPASELEEGEAWRQRSPELVKHFKIPD